MVGQEDDESSCIGGGKHGLGGEQVGIEVGASARSTQVEDLFYLVIKNYGEHCKLHSMY